MRFFLLEPRFPHLAGAPHFVFFVARGPWSGFSLQSVVFSLKKEFGFMKKVIGLLILCAVTMAVLSGCQTWDGFGRDVEKLGQKMQ